MTHWSMRTWAEQRARLEHGLPPGETPLERGPNLEAFAARLLPIFDTALLEPDADPGRFGAQLQVAIVAVIEQAVEFTHCDDAWYWYVERGVRWLCEARGLSLDDEQRAQLLTLVRSCFKSWICEDADINRANDQLTAYLLERVGATIPAEANDALREHLAVTRAVDWRAPPESLARAFAEIDALAWRETGAMERYLEQFDRPAQLLSGATEAEADARQRRFEAALARVRELADDCALVDWARLREVQALVLGRPAGFRERPAHARGGRERYGWWPELEAVFARKIEDDDGSGHAVAKAARLYLDILYVHPFDDGNARAARLWLEFVLRRDGVPTPELGGLIKWPKGPPSAERYVRFQELIAAAILATSA